MPFSIAKLETSTGADLAVYSWPTSKKPIATVHINHGMSEHSARYDRFATALNEAGYNVIAHDHRGHGQTSAPDAQQGLFASKNGWDKVLGDVDDVVSFARKEFEYAPIVVFGHSMGAIVGLNYCIRNSDRIHGAALWNSGVDGGILLSVLKMLLGFERMFKGSDVPSGLAKKLTFETWNKKFAPNRTDFDWLSRDAAEVDLYVADPMCGFDACNGLWRDLTKGISIGADDGQLLQIRRDLPVHLKAGGQDPCSDNARAVGRLANRLEQVGMTDVTLAIDPQNRHESLNEVIRDEVTAEFIDWLDRRFAK